MPPINTHHHIILRPSPSVFEIFLKRRAHVSIFGHPGQGIFRIYLRMFRYGTADNYRVTEKGVDYIFLWFPSTIRSDTRYARYDDTKEVERGSGRYRRESSNNIFVQRADLIMNELCSKEVSGSFAVTEFALRTYWSVVQSLAAEHWQIIQARASI